MGATFDPESFWPRLAGSSSRKAMKNLILNNWAAKLASLVLASVLWFLIRKNLEETGPKDDGMQAPLVLTPTDGSHRNE